MIYIFLKNNKQNLSNWILSKYLIPDPIYKLDITTFKEKHTQKDFLENFCFLNPIHIQRYLYIMSVHSTKVLRKQKELTKCFPFFSIISVWENDVVSSFLPLSSGIWSHFFFNIDVAENKETEYIYSQRKVFCCFKLFFYTCKS